MRAREPMDALRLKAYLLARGVDVDAGAAAAMTASESRPLIAHDYATTNGVLLRIGADLFVTARVSPASEARLSLRDGALTLTWDGREHEAEYFSPPAYAFADNPRTDGFMTHADRLRISPIDGCSCSCRFCDSPLSSYRFRPLEGLLEGLRVALADPWRPPAHILVSGGTPRRGDDARLDESVAGLVSASPIPVDVMLTPRCDTDVIDRFVELGVHGLSLNVEVFRDDVRSRVCPEKHAVGLDAYGASLGRAVTLLGRTGRVRSLLLVGLEPPEATLDGVRFLAALGCDPVLSPFQPAPGTALADHPAPDPAELAALHTEAARICAEAGVRLGPRCIPCQHNTLTVPEPALDYHYTGAVEPTRLVS